MAPTTHLLMCLSLALLVLVQGYPFDPEDDFEPEGEDVDLGDLGDFAGLLDGPLSRPLMMMGEQGDETDDDIEGDVDGLDQDPTQSAQDRLLALYDMYERDRRGARWNKNFVGISSLDRSITAYTSFLPCPVEGLCKSKFKQTFRCKCNKHTYCVGPGRKYEARCRYSAVGHVFYQP